MINYIDNIMDPKPLNEYDLSSSRLCQVKWAGALMCAVLYFYMAIAIIGHDYDTLLRLAKAVFTPNPWLGITILFLSSISILTALCIIGKHPGLWRLGEVLKQHDEWETRTALQMSRYGWYVAIINAGLVIFGLGCLWLHKGMFNVSVINVGVLFALSAALQVFGGFTVWAWRQKPLED